MICAETVRCDDLLLPPLLRDDDLSGSDVDRRAFIVSGLSTRCRAWCSALWMSSLPPSALIASSLRAGPLERCFFLEDEEESRSECGLLLRFFLLWFIPCFCLLASAAFPALFDL